jgi:hypothetical protein
MITIYVHIIIVLLKEMKKEGPFLCLAILGILEIYVLIKKKKKYTPKNCVCGIFCQYIHNKNEYNYHPDHFQKDFECTRKKVKGKCIYYKTCYGYHLNENEKNSLNEEEEVEEEEENENKIKEEAENDEEVLEKQKKADSTFIVAKIFRCRKCQNISKKGELIYFLKCKHFVCIKCFKKIISENKKNNQNEKEKLISCPFCSEELKKNEIIKLNY